MHNIKSSQEQSKSKEIIFKISKIPNIDENNDNNITNLRRRHALTKISNLVKNFIKEKGQATVNEVIKYVVDCLKGKQNKEQIKQIKEHRILKNIQRRVYDSINVMAAMNLLRKEKSILTTTEILTQNEGIQIKENTYDSNQNNLNEEIDKLSKEIDFKKQKLIDLYVQLCFVKKYSHLNKIDFNRVLSNEKINFPFYLIQNDPNKIYIHQEKNQHNRCTFLSETPILVQNPQEIMCKLVANELSEKIKGLNELSQVVDNNAMSIEELNISSDTTNEMKIIDEQARKIGLNIFDSDKKSNCPEELIFNYLGRNNIFKSMISKKHYPKN